MPRATVNRLRSCQQSLVGTIVVDFTGASTLRSTWAARVPSDFPGLLLARSEPLLPNLCRALPADPSLPRQHRQERFSQSAHCSTHGQHPRAPVLPLCTRIPDFEKALPHVSLRCGFSPCVSATLSARSVPRTAERLRARRHRVVVRHPLTRHAVARVVAPHEWPWVREHQWERGTQARRVAQATRL